MSISRQYVNMNFCFKDAINKSMLLRDFTAPSAFRLSPQRFWVSQPSLWMIIKLTNEPHSLFVSLRLIAQQFFQVCQSLFLI